MYVNVTCIMFVIHPIHVSDVQTRLLYVHVQCTMYICATGLNKYQ